jgi:hypothetical protein
MKKLYYPGLLRLLLFDHKRLFNRTPDRIDDKIAQFAAQQLVEASAQH